MSFLFPKINSADPEEAKRAFKPGILSDDKIDSLLKRDDIVIRSYIFEYVKRLRPALLERIKNDPSHPFNRRALSAGEEKATETINKYDLNIVFGTDSFGDPELVDRYQLEDFIYFKKRFGNWKALKAATGNVHELFKLATYQNPYPEGKIGVLEEGSFADLLIIDGNPVEDVAVLADRNNIKLIMKDAKVYKNELV